MQCCPAALLLEILATYSPEGSVPHNLLWCAGILLLVTDLPGAQRSEVEEELLWPCCRPAQDFIAVIGCVGLGISLYLIHIYVTPLKRFVQASCAGQRSAALLSSCLAHLHQLHSLRSCAGFVCHGLSWGPWPGPNPGKDAVLGHLQSAVPEHLVKSIVSLQPEPVTQYVASHPGAVWLVGPLFAAVTGAEATPALPRMSPNSGGVSYAPGPALALSMRQKLLPQDWLSKKVCAMGRLRPPASSLLHPP